MSTSEKRILYRNAVNGDTPLLAQMNRALIEAEGHGNTMMQAQLERRLRQWMREDYKAVIFLTQQHEPMGYALYRILQEFVYLRHLYIAAEYRRQGVGRSAMQILCHDHWPRHKRLRVECLCSNEPALEFYRSLGFQEYAIVFEKINRD